MWTNPAFWTSLAGIAGAVAALIKQFQHQKNHVPPATNTPPKP